MRLSTIESMPTTQDIGLDQCESESKMAERLKFNPRRFYVDVEKVCMDIDPSTGGIFFVLTNEFEGHASGKLVFQSFVGLRSPNFGKPGWDPELDVYFEV